MNKEQAINFLIDMKLYFQKLQLETKEDMAFQSYQQNAENCRKIAEMLYKGELP